MRKMVLVVTILLLIGVAGVAKLRMDAQKHLRQLRQENVDLQLRLDKNLRDVRAATEAWQYCHANPPTTKEQKLVCKNLDEWHTGLSPKISSKVQPRLMVRSELRDLNLTLPRMGGGQRFDTGNLL